MATIGERCSGKNTKGKKCRQVRGTRLFPEDLEGSYCLYHVVQDPNNQSGILCCQGVNGQGKACSFHPRYPRGLVSDDDLKYLKVSPFCRHHIAEGLAETEYDVICEAFRSRFGPEASGKIVDLVLDFSDFGCVTPILWDLETTGLDFLENEIVEIAAMNRLTGESFHSLVKPNGEIDEEASKIHGYYAADLIKAPSIVEVFQKFIGFVMQFHNPVLIAHYGKKFDVPMMNLEMLRKSRDFDFILSSLRFVDSIELFKHLNPINVHPRHKPYCIQSLSNYFGYERTQTHQAFDDVDMLDEILVKLQDKAGELPWEKFIFRFDVKTARSMLHKHVLASEREI